MNKDIKIELKKIVDNTKVELKQVADSAKQQIVLKLVIPYLTDYLKDLVAEKQSKESNARGASKYTYRSTGATKGQYLGHYVPRWVKSSFTDIANHTVFNKNKSDPVKETLNSTETHPSFLSFIKKAHPELINDPAFAGDDDSIFEKDNEVPKSKEELREIVRYSKASRDELETALKSIVEFDFRNSGKDINHKELDSVFLSKPAKERKPLGVRPSFKMGIEPRKTKEELKKLYTQAKANLINCTAVVDPSFSKELFKIFKGDSSNAPEPPLSKGDIVRPKAIKEEQAKPKCTKEKIENKPPTTKSRRISKK